MRQRLEYAIVWLWVKTVGLLPRPLARAKGIALGLIVYLVHRRLRRVGMRNLALAFPTMPRASAAASSAANSFPSDANSPKSASSPATPGKTSPASSSTTASRTSSVPTLAGKGVLFLTGHVGAWELSAFAHSLQGHPLSIVMRSLDNPYVDALIQSYRTMHGNRTVEKDDFVRGLLAAMRAGETVGILMDTNMTPPQGVFVDFFGIPACTASGLARIALRTDAAVVPGFTIWDSKLRKYILRFDSAVELVRTGDDQADIVANTAKFTKVIEDYVRRYPDQWLWVHRRWKTRPEGEPALY